MKLLLRFFYRLLYHEFAFTYDLVAAIVSVGRWKDWVLSVVPFINGPRVLEIGHGPGHLQRVLLSRGLSAIGIDASMQMGRLAKHNLTGFLRSTTSNSRSIEPNTAYAQVNLARGVSQHLPFLYETFDTIVATFPSLYIFDPKTLQEAQRVLIPNGRLVILPGATILGRGVLDRVMALLFSITGQGTPDVAEVLQKRYEEPFLRAGFSVELHELNIRSSMVFIIVATKAPQ